MTTATTTNLCLTHSGFELFVRNMVFFVVHSECLKLKYKTTICSKTTIFMLITAFINLALPFIIAYHTKGFWLKRDRFQEKPDIKYRYEYLLAADTNQVDNPILCSNVISGGKFDRCSLIQVYEEDEDGDGLYDSLDVNITVQVPERTNVVTVTLMLFLDYEIKNVCPVRMESAVILQHHISFPVTSVTFLGDVELKQMTSVPCGVHRTFGAYHPLIQEEYDLQNILRAYHMRDLATRAGGVLTLWAAGTSPELQLEARLRYGEHTVYYTPTFWQVMKSAWVQYLAVHVAVAWCVSRVRTYVFQNNLVWYRAQKIKQLVD